MSNESSSYCIRIHNWEGTNQHETVHRFAKVFKISIDEAVFVLEKIALGKTWRFPRTVSKKQGEIALAYLTELGFVMDISPANANSVASE